MPNTIIIGTQWGDEGKGAFIDRLAEEHDVVVRYQGGNNAGHTVYIGDERYALHLLPSGILRKGKICIIGNNVLIDSPGLIKEIRELRERGIEITPENLKISHTAPVVMEYNRVMDGARENAGDGKKIGTTKKAIGPTYEDKCARTGVRVCDLFTLDDKALEAKVAGNLKLKNHILAYYGVQPVSLEKMMDELMTARTEIEPFVCRDIRKVIYDHDGSILAEGAQGNMLDIDFGTYPFVTSSNPTKGGFYTGTGAGGIIFQKVVGIVKAYTTRVGDGPFPTELNDETGERLRAKGKEFGTTTGRPRRCGWLDLPVVKYAAEVNGLTSLAITKLDVLSEEPWIKIGTGYTINGERADYFPVEQLEKCEPTYATVSGWKKDISGARRLDDLPNEALSYLDFIKDYLQIPIEWVGVSPKRDGAIVV